MSKSGQQSFRQLDFSQKGDRFRFCVLGFNALDKSDYPECIQRVFMLQSESRVQLLKLKEEISEERLPSFRLPGSS